MNNKSDQDKNIYLSQRRLIWISFRKHKLALLGLLVLCVLYLAALFAPFIAPYSKAERFKDYQIVPPTKIHFVTKEGNISRPFIYLIEIRLNKETYKYEHIEIETQPLKIEFFVEAQPYKLFSIIPMKRKLFGIQDAPIFILGSDRLGRDLFSRILYASQISLSIGFVGVALSFVIGCFLGAISGFLGGVADEIIQRAIDLIISIPQIPLWMALSAAVPQEWTVVQTYFAITVILSAVGWTTLARVVRGKLISLREEDFAFAAKIAGASEMRIILRHLLPNFLSYLVVSVTLAVPGMILAETALSFLGLGMQAPAVSWGTLLQDAQYLSILAISPWHLWPIAFVIVTILMFNFVGDGLRDAADPYSR